MMPRREAKHVSSFVSSFGGGLLYLFAYLYFFFLWWEGGTIKCMKLHEKRKNTQISITG